MGPVAWRPDEEVTARAQLTRFLRFTGRSSWEDLYCWSITDIAGFTDRLIQFLDIQFQRPYTRVLDESGGAPWPRWCIGAELNIAATCLRHPAHSLAIMWEGEDGSVRQLTYGELREEVDAAVAGFRALGVGKGDAIAIHLPMLPETVVVLLAAAQMGAVAVPLFSGYGPSAIESRVRDVGAKVLITCESFSRRGKPVLARVVAEQAVSRCLSVEHLLVVRDSSWRPSGANAEMESTEAEDPLVVLYTSGTTGRAKGIQHSHCGFPIKAAQDMCFGMDVGPGTRISWVTDIGWMMGPWLIYGATILGATLVLHDGAPDYPDPGRMWSFCARHKVDVLGISPTLVRALAAHGDEPVRQHDLSALKILASTGEPWNPDPWWWLFDVVGRGLVPIINYSGGTEISGGILSGNPLLPVKPCSFPAPCLGIAADVADDHGRSVPAGTVGELVIRKPWIGMARGFLRDPERYLATYWSRWPGVWAHGDWAQRDEDGHWYILGRSDDTLKIAGKRVGPAEVESVLVSHPAVVEAAVIGVPHELKGEAMVAFCVLSNSQDGSQDLQAELCDLIARELGKPLRPERVAFVAALPKTRNAKVMRRVIRAAYLNGDPGDVTALENPAAVESIREVRNSHP